MPDATLKNGKTLAMRMAVPDDAAALLDFLCTATGDSQYLISTPESFAALTVEQERAFIEATAAAPTSCMLCGLVDDTMAALATLNGPAHPRIAHTAELSLLVGSGYRGLGAGSAMVRELAAFARAAGALRTLYLGVHAQNAPAIALYEKLGFRHTGRREGYFLIDGQLGDELLMQLEL